MAETPGPDLADGDDVADGTLLVHTEPDPDGTYKTVVTVMPLGTQRMDPVAAVLYAVTAHFAAHVADTDAAIVADMTGHVPDEAIAQLLVGLHAKRHIADEATHPMRFHPIVTVDRQPQVELYYHGERIGEAPPSDIHRHAGAVLDAAAIASLDGDLRRALIDWVDIDDSEARSAVACVGRRRQLITYQAANTEENRT